MKQRVQGKMTDLSGPSPTNQAQRALSIALFTERMTSTGNTSILTKLRRLWSAFWIAPVVKRDIHDLSAGEVRRIIAKESGCACRFHNRRCATCDHILSDIYPS